jgi:hypothetical protein
MDALTNVTTVLRGIAWTSARSWRRRSGTSGGSRPRTAAAASSSTTRTGSAPRSRPARQTSLARSRRAYHAGDRMASFAATRSVETDHWYPKPVANRFI